LQNARRIFCDQFARMPERPIHILKDALMTASSKA